MKNNKGFGILEILIVIAIIVLMIVVLLTSKQEVHAQSDVGPAGVVRFIIPNHSEITQEKYEADLIALQEYLLEQQRIHHYKIVDHGETRQLSVELQDYLYKTMEAYGIATEENYKTILAQLYCESNYITNLIDNQDYGLAQINKSVHSYMRKQLGISNINGSYDFLDPYTSIDCCVWLMADGIKQYGIEGALVRYNYGHINKSYSSPYSRKVLKTVWLLEEVEE